MRSPNPTEKLAQAADRALGASADRAGLLPFLKARIRPRPRTPWTLEGHEYLRAIAQDPARVIVVEKAAQMGVSTLMLADLIYYCLAGRNAGYFLNAQGQMREFVQARLDPIIDADAELTRQVVEGRFQPDDPAFSRRRRGGKSADNVRLKQIGAGTAYFLATSTMGDLKTRDLDAIYMDEVAELDEAKAEFAQDRLLHSDLKLQRWFSQPDIPEMDIDDWFQRSTKSYWHLHCSKCASWWSLEQAFPGCLYHVRGEWRIGCPKCHVKLDPDRGHWIPTHPGRPISGYHLSQLYGPHITPAEIAEQWEQAQTRPSRMRRFQISILGNPYGGDRQPITDALLNTRCGDWGISPMGQAANLPSRVGQVGNLSGLPSGLPFAGIDQGDLIHLAIGRLSDGVIRIVWLEETPSWELVEKRLRDHQVQMFCSDAMPYKTEAKRLCRALKSGAIVYSSARRTIYGMEDAETEPVHTINVDRTEYMDRVVDAFTSGGLFLPRPSLEQTAQARDHLKRFVKDRRDDGSMVYRRNVANHYGMAIAAILLAVEGQSALGLAPAGHFSSSMSHERSRHIVGDNLAPRKW